MPFEEPPLLSKITTEHALLDSHFRKKHAGEVVDTYDREAYMDMFSAVASGIAKQSDAEEKKKGSKKWRRTSAQDLIFGVDHQLKVLTGKGLERFLPKSIDTVPVHLRAHLAH